MIKIEIDKAEVRTKSGVSARTGKPYSIREQKGYVYLCDGEGRPNKHPSTLIVMLGDDQPPYGPGFYTIAPSSFYTDRFDNLALSPVLVPIPQAGKAAA